MSMTRGQEQRRNLLRRATNLAVISDEAGRWVAKSGHVRNWLRANGIDVECEHGSNQPRVVSFPRAEEYQAFCDETSCLVSSYVGPAGIDPRTLINELIERNATEYHVA